MDINQNHSGLGNNIVNIGSQPRYMDEGLKNELKNLEKDKKITVICVMGDPEAFSFAHEILSFLKNNGYDAEGVTQSMYDKPVIGLGIEKSPDGKKIDLIIGSKKN